MATSLKCTNPSFEIPVTNESIQLAMELKGAVKQAAEFCNIAAQWHFKNLAFALEKYGTSKNIFAQYCIPNPNDEKQTLITTVYKTFHSVLNENAGYGTLNTIDNFRGKPQSPKKQHALNSLLSVSDRAIDYISHELHQTPSCSRTTVKEICNMSYGKIKASATNTTPKAPPRFQ